MGGAWGLGFSLAKLAAIDGTTPMGIAFWQCLFASILLLVFVFFGSTKIVISRRLIKLYVIVLPEYLLESCQSLSRWFQFLPIH